MAKNSPSKRRQSFTSGFSPSKRQKKNESNDKSHNGAKENNIKTKSFYNSPKGYLSPLERKKINELKNANGESTLDQTKKVPSPKTVKKTSPNRIKKTSPSRIKKTSPNRIKKPRVEKKSEVLVINKSKSSPAKNSVMKFFGKKTPIKSPSKAHRMTLNMGRNLQIQFGNLRRSPRKLVRDSSPLKNIDNIGEVCSSVLFTDIPEKSSNSLESDLESGFSEETSSNANDSPVAYKFVKSISGSPLLNKQRMSPKVSNKIPKVKPMMEQMMIDAGQKDFGAVRCPTCNMIFTVRDPQDEMAHSKFHNMFVNTLRFPGWKKEDVMNDLYDGRIIRVLPNSAKHQMQKVDELRQLIDTDLGFPNVGLVNPRATHYYIFISTELKKIVGCVIAEPIAKAFKVFQDLSVQNSKVWCRDKTPVSAISGISRVWVLPQFRRQKIASRLLDAVSLNFAYGSVISKNQMAFSDPTPDGREFISSYTGTNSFLVYGGFDTCEPAMDLKIHS